MTDTDAGALCDSHTQCEFGAQGTCVLTSSLGGGNVPQGPGPTFGNVDNVFIKVLTSSAKSPWFLVERPATHSQGNGVNK